MSYEYVANGEKVVLEVDEDLIAVRFREPTARSQRAEVAAAAEIGPFAERMEIPQEAFTILPVAPHAQPRRQRYMAAVARMEGAEEVERVAPVFKRGDLRAVATDRLLLGTEQAGAGARQFLQAQGLEVLEEFGDGNEFMVRLPADIDPFAALAQLAQLEDVTYVEPDFVIVGKHTQRLAAPGPAAGDPLLPRQYAAQITQAVDAWQSGEGAAAIRIAILDEGVDTGHEDLAAALVGGYDAAEDDAFQEPNGWDGHGTACAGLAAGVPNNNLGVRGIGGGCSLLAVRIAYSASQGANWTTTDGWIRRGIDWAWQNGADVLSNSWGGGLPSTALKGAFERARTRGRGGKGSIVVIAAGNESGPVSFPGSLPDVLTVSASNEFDQFKTKTSSDGESWWGSNFGPEVDVAAPGVHNYTTDIMGGAGYNPQGHYVPDFNGTSSATPIVAGAAGLILSANPDLGEAEVRRIIGDTADKVGGFPFFGGRNDQMGKGRLNVARAVEAARRLQGAVAGGSGYDYGNGNGNGNGSGNGNGDGDGSGHQPLYVAQGAAQNGGSAAPAAAAELTGAERGLLVDQALDLIDNFYVHLPLKRAMHAVDPAQRLKLLKYRLPKLNDRRFHNEMISIFTSLRDLHTNYMLPEPYNKMGFYLPFLLEEFYEEGRRQYMASKVAVGFAHPTFAPGVVITHWNGIPIDKAVANNAERNAGSNEDARLARGLEGMTVRPLIMALPPDEEWVDVRYTAGGAVHDLRFAWRSMSLASGDAGLLDAGVLETATNLAVDVQTEVARRMKKALFAPGAMEVERQVAQAEAGGAAGPGQGVDLSKVSSMPDNFQFRTVDTPRGPVGYLRIYSFASQVLDPLFVDHFVQEFMRILTLMPANGLIIDVRGNGGGYITAGEKILQMLTPRQIEPERLQFVNTPLTLQLCTQTTWLKKWAHSVQLAVETGDIFSQGFPLEAGAAYNQIGRKYHGPVTLITDALCYSTTDIFAAGFQDHEIGPILGVHGNTGAGGANVWTHDLLLDLLPEGSPLRPLPRGANFRVAIRRTSRVGERAGLPLEDVGVIPDRRYAMTRRDLLGDNADLIAAAVELLFA